MEVFDIVLILVLISVLLVSILDSERLSMKLLIIAMSPAVVMSLFLLFKHEAPEFIFLLLGVFCGFIISIVSIFLTEKSSLISSLKEYNSNIVSFFNENAIKHKDNWEHILYTTMMVIYEELIWRVLLVETLSKYLHVVPVILIASFLFFYSHVHLRRFSIQSIELLLFSLVITTIYYFTESFTLVLLIHWIRNMIIIMNVVGAEEREALAKV